MIRDAFSKIYHTSKDFKRIIKPLNRNLNLVFGYMIVMQDGRYYKLMEDHDCLKKFVNNVTKSSIFCARNVTTYYDMALEYNFTIWPNIPIIGAMEIYYEHNIRNGISISRINKQSTEIYFFTRKEYEIDWHRFYIRNKTALINFIEHFKYHKELLLLDDKNLSQGMFNFSEGFDREILESEYLQKEEDIIRRFINVIKTPESLLSDKGKFSLTNREIEILSTISYGTTIKSTAKEFNISESTIRFHLENIKRKIGVSNKSELIKFFHNNGYVKF